MKHLFTIAALLALSSVAAHAQVGVGTTAPDAKSALDIRATDKGLLIPRLTAGQRTGILNPPQGLMVYQTDGSASGGAQTGFWYYAGTGGWVLIDPAASALTLPYSGSASTSGSAFAVSNTGTGSALSGTGSGASTPAVQGVNNNAGGGATGVLGTTLGGYGVIGRATASGGYGVSGSATDSRGVNGFSVSGPGLYGNSTTGVSVQGAKGTSDKGRVAQFTSSDAANDSTAVYVSTSGDRPALRAVNTATSAQAAIRGVKQAAAADGAGVEGVVTTGASGNAAGVRGLDRSGGSGVIGLTTSGYGVRGIASANGGYGVSGSATNSYGVIGSSTSASGVYGSTSANANSVAGVQGVGNGGAAAVGVLGLTTNGFGVRGVASASGGYGVLGVATTGYGVRGSSTSGAGVRGTSDTDNGVEGASASSSGVEGISGSGSGVLGSSTSSYGVRGATSAGNTGSAAGVWGAASGGGVGVLGSTTSGYGVRGTASATGGQGVIGLANGSTGIGVYGVAAAGTAADAVNGAASGTGRAAYFVQNGSGSTANALEVVNTNAGRTAYFNQANTGNTSNAVEINSTGTGIGLKITHPAALNSGATQGVIVVDPAGDNKVALRSESVTVSASSTSEYTQFFAGHGSMNTAGPQALVAFGNSNDPNFGVIQASSFSGGIAGKFQGTVQVIGNLSKSGGSFKIDHPLDPENQYLYHSFVESPDMMNIYNGNVTLDASGEATVQLPDWFEALNRDFRYQLTPIGAAFTPYVKAKVAGNQFRIAGQPGAEVSWQVTGIRHDKWADANRIPVEQAKESTNRGKYLHPKLFGQSAERGIGHVEPMEPSSPIRAAAAPGK